MKKVYGTPSLTIHGSISTLTKLGISGGTDFINLSGIIG